MSAKNATMSAKVATMSAKDALIPRHDRQGRDHVRQGRNHERQERNHERQGERRATRRFFLPPVLANFAAVFFLRVRMLRPISPRTAEGFVREPSPSPQRLFFSFDFFR